MEIEFIASAKDVKSRNLVSGDKSYRVVLEGRDKRLMELDRAKPFEDLRFRVSVAEGE